MAAVLESVEVRRPPTWRWVHIGVAAFAMVATLPGRTHGLGLVTEPLLADLDLGRVEYGVINLWATLLGAAFCLPVGWLIDRLGLRLVLGGVLAGLGAVVAVMSQVNGAWVVVVPYFGQVMLDLFLMVLLTRGLGQSALSVVSLALVGKAAGRRQGLAMGVYSFTMALGFMAAFTLIKHLIEDGVGWRDLWAGIGIYLLVTALPAAVLVRPHVTGWAAEGADERAAAIGTTLVGALRTPAFWVFGLATSLYGLITSGVSLFNQSILAERGFPLQVFLTITALGPIVGLASNLATGAAATRWPLGRLMALAMLLMTAALVAFPLVQTLWQVYLYAAVMGVAGGMVTVLFFAVWGQAFGPAHLGKIQGAAQMMTVFASALGPLLMALAKEQTGSYVPLFTILAGLTALLAVTAWLTPLPSPIRE